MTSETHRVVHFIQDFEYIIHILQTQVLKYRRRNKTDNHHKPFWSSIKLHTAKVVSSTVGVQRELQ